MFINDHNLATKLLYYQYYSKSDFPKCGGIEATRAWLDKHGFEGKFIGWKADKILGLERTDIPDLGGEKGLMLFSLINTARRTTGS